MLFTGDGPDEARELLKFLWVRVCVLGEMGVVAVVIVVVAVVVVVVVVFVIVVEAESSNFKGLEKEKEFRVFLILGNPGFNGFIALTRYCRFLLFGFEEDEMGLGFGCLRRPERFDWLGSGLCFGRVTGVKGK